MVEISQGERLGQHLSHCSLQMGLPTGGVPLAGILSLFLSAQQLCSGELLRLAKPLENGEASIGVISDTSRSQGRPGLDSWKPEHPCQGLGRGGGAS